MPTIAPTELTHRERLVAMIDDDSPTRLESPSERETIANTIEHLDYAECVAAELTETQRQLDEARAFGHKTIAMAAKVSEVNAAEWDRFLRRFILDRGEAMTDWRFLIRCPDYGGMNRYVTAPTWESAVQEFRKSWIYDNES